MHSNSAAWVRGVARFNSSTSRHWVNTGPLRNTKAPVCMSGTLTPVTSEGSRSGVP